MNVLRVNQDMNDDADGVLAKMTFQLMALTAELEVTQRVVFGLLEPSLEGRIEANSLPRKVHGLTALLINQKLAELADDYPKQVPEFSLLFEQWKKSRNL